MGNLWIYGGCVVVFGLGGRDNGEDIVRFVGDVRVDMFDEDDAKICDIVFSLGKLTGGLGRW
jgi:hypothetical protein